MQSAVRLAANAANAQLSTGPRTPEGKARSSQNARKHGLTARHFVVTEDEREEFDEFLAEYEETVAPEGPIESTIFQELTVAAWNPAPHPPSGGGSCHWPGRPAPRRQRRTNPRPPRPLPPRQ